MSEAQNQKPAAITLPGTVEKIIPPVVPNEPEKAQIVVEAADDLYKEIRVENKLEDGDGKIAHADCFDQPHSSRSARDDLGRSQCPFA